ncbi:GDP-mannose transporter [Seminavis robusta]|uniref:GDP-mannose transporter n=1 Tax=Seminavis robusta TaxID=568900 RepID=A0A9N8DQN4_9STRA|nr:GDP-mannose transporter [Seminavis robusta]|eukprot:Sro188_g081320.1 GDP-mannose transporter (394) ;mRNA; r:85028-86209
MAPPKGEDSSDRHHYDDVELASLDGSPKARHNALSSAKLQQDHGHLISPPTLLHSKNPPVPSPTKASNTTNTSSNHSSMSASSLQGKAVSACLLYSFCSVSMVLTNKSLASSYSDKTPIDLNILLVVFQALFAVFCVDFSKRMGWVEYPELTVETIKLWVPVNLFFCAMLFTGMASLQHNSVPMVTIFKNITNIMVAAGDLTFFGASVEALVIASFAVTLSGAIAAAWNDISSSWMGLFWMSANCVSSAGYVLYMKYATKHIKLSKFGMVFVNNLLCAVFLFPVSMMKGEVVIFFSTGALHTLDYFGKNCVAGFMGFFLNFAALNCVQTTGPTTYAVVGSLNKIPVALLGYLMFDSEISQQTWFFICVSLCGGFLYSYAKIRQAGHKTAQGSK